MAVKSPPSETNGESSEHVTPGAQNATSTAPDQIVATSVASNQNDSEETKIVRSSPGV